jgi:uncharacterized protein YukE
MTEMLYDHSAGETLAQVFKAKAQLLHEHADELMQAGNALVAEHLQGAAADAFHQHLLIIRNSAVDIANTISNHSNAVTSSFHGMAGTDAAGAQSMSI